MTEFESGLPSIRQLQSFIQNKKEVEIKLLTQDQDIMVGKMLWQDQNCVCLQNQDQQSVLIWWQSIAYIKLKL